MKFKIDNKKTGFKIATLMAQKNISISNVAKEIGVKETTIYQWIKGRVPNIQNLYNLSKLLGVKIEELIVFRRA